MGSEMCIRDRLSLGVLPPSPSSAPSFPANLARMPSLSRLSLFRPRARPLDLSGSITAFSPFPTHATSCSPLPEGHTCGPTTIFLDGSLSTRHLSSTSPGFPPPIPPIPPWTVARRPPVSFSPHHPPHPLALALGQPGEASPIEPARVLSSRLRRSRDCLCRIGQQDLGVGEQVELE